MNVRIASVAAICAALLGASAEALAENADRRPLFRATNPAVGGSQSIAAAVAVDRFSRELNDVLRELSRRDPVTPSSSPQAISEIEAMVATAENAVRELRSRGASGAWLESNLAEDAIARFRSQIAFARSRPDPATIAEFEAAREAHQGALSGVQGARAAMSRTGSVSRASSVDAIERWLSIAEALLPAAREVALMERDHPSLANPIRSLYLELLVKSVERALPEVRGLRAEKLAGEKQAGL